ncbi:hypothetical protein NQ176_g2775 [Zarea fungicola]|uniref:Uncharacterized protein n=1 Tax=Zarea fungicola TaxID=93591 RepID=A0ACC1NMS2_9HYPO|nr:hypothetical protein NQ176_g2775 [Lecanicillium fungicola]
MSAESAPLGHRRGLEQALRTAELSFVRYMDMENWTVALHYIDQGLRLLADRSTRNCEEYMAPTLDMFDAMSDTSPTKCYWCSRLTMPFFFARGRVLFRLGRYEEVSDAMYYYADIKHALTKGGEPGPGPDIEAFSHHASIQAQLRPLEASVKESIQSADWTKAADTIGECMLLFGPLPPRPSCFWCKLLVLILYKTLLGIYTKSGNEEAHRLTSTHYEELKEIIRIEGERYCN